MNLSINSFNYGNYSNNKAQNFKSNYRSLEEYSHLDEKADLLELNGGVDKKQANRDINNRIVENLRNDENRRKADVVWLEREIERLTKDGNDLRKQVKDLSNEVKSMKKIMFEFFGRYNIKTPLLDKIHKDKLKEIMEDVICTAITSNHNKKFHELKEEYKDIVASPNIHENLLIHIEGTNEPVKKMDFSYMKIYLASNNFSKCDFSHIDFSDSYKQLENKNFDKCVFDGTKFTNMKNTEFKNCRFKDVKIGPYAQVDAWINGQHVQSPREFLNIANKKKQISL